ncbi:Oligosaccharyltransferase subunit Ribophorin II-domain-containing protein [Hypomontagnella submonticulosa]|nr:Oligosaccharyltransferase subunit Ribophorin II-domain-containing protein [Hypomontagnella submonticulosa]
MRFLHSFVAPLLLLAAGAAQAASSWGFDDAKLTVSAKKAAAGAKEKDTRQFNEKSTLLPTPVTFDSSDSLKLLLTTKEEGKGKRPHQAFLVLREPTSGLEAPFPLTVKDNGKAVVEIKHSDLPVQLAIATSPLRASLVIASFGSSEGFKKDVFDVQVTRDPGAKPIVYEKPLRYGKREEIHHIFRADPKSPPKIISFVFVLAVVATLPALFIGWLMLGANISHLPKALSAAPVAHSVFFGSIVAMEGVFYMYYSSWNLFQTLPVIGVVAVAAFLSGAKALGEVQSRRLAGER